MRTPNQSVQDRARRIKLADVLYVRAEEESDDPRVEAWRSYRINDRKWIANLKSAFLKSSRLQAYPDEPEAVGEVGLLVSFVFPNEEVVVFRVSIDLVEEQWGNEVLAESRKLRANLK